MINSSLVIHSRQLFANGIKGQVLKDGSQVLVRIISDKGNGNYEGSLAGVRVNIASQKKLEPGTFFKAKITLNNNQIEIVPQNNQLTEAFTDEVQINQLQNNQLFQFIEAFGLPGDEISQRLFQQMKQLNMKLDVSLLNKLHKLSVKFKGKEKKAAELMLMLSKKGVSFTNEELLAFLEELDLDDSNSNQKNESNHNKFILMNKNNQITGDWQFLPFEIVSNEKNKSENADIENQLANGNVKFLFDSQNKLKMMNVDCLWKENKNIYKFSVDYVNGKAEKISYFFNGNNLKEKESKFVQIISKMDKNLICEKVSEEFLEGNCCSKEIFYSAGGMA